MNESTATCARCHERPPKFALAGRTLCLHCMFLQPKLIKRSLLTALVVGTILTGINQGTVLFSDHVPASLAWKVPLTYCVPFCVAIFSALLNTRIASAAGASTASR